MIDRKDLKHESWCNFRKGDSCVCGTNMGPPPNDCDWPDKDCTCDIKEDLL